VVSIIVSGLVLLVAGETDFDPLGFILAMTAACLAGFRFTLTQVLGCGCLGRGAGRFTRAPPPPTQTRADLDGRPGALGLLACPACSPSRPPQMLLHGSHDKHAFGSPLEVLEALTPIMAASTMVLSLMFECLWTSLPASPYFSTLGRALLTGLIIALGAIIAFCMVGASARALTRGLGPGAAPRQECAALARLGRPWCGEPASAKPSTSMCCRRCGASMCLCTRPPP
jgi:hypothetical protein